MHATRRHWMVVSLGLSFSALAVLLDRPALVFGTVGVACWLLLRYLSFASELERLFEGMSVSQSISRSRVPTNTPLSVTLDVTRPRRSTLGLAVESRPPLSARGATTANRTVSLDADEEAATTTYTVRFPTAGTTSFETPELTITDALGLFTVRTRTGDEPTVTAEQRNPANVHVGQGGKRTQTMYGDQNTERNTSGLATVEIREYTTGDSLRRIDWNSTARFNYPHVREYESESDRRVAVFIDHRPSVTSGRAGETQFAYLREAALALVTEAQRRSDSVALYAIGSDGVTASYSFRSTSEHYAAIRETLYSLSSEEGGYGVETAQQPSSAIVASRGRRALREDDSQFAVRIRPFLSNASGTVPSGTEPLFQAVQTHLTRHSENVQVALFTSDAHQNEIRNCVRYASWRARRTHVFLAPEVLFEPKGLSELDETYNEYVSFERFRRQVSSYTQVSAFEVGPGDRIDTILSSARQVRV